MNPDVFDDLCLRALAGRDAAARAQVEEIVSNEPAFAAQWQELQAVWLETNTLMVDAAALKKNSGDTPISSARLGRLMEPVRAAEKNARARSRRLQWIGGLGFATVACVVALLVIKGPTPSQITLDLSRVPARAQRNFFSPSLAHLSTGTQLVTWRSGSAPAIRSPRVATAWTQPELAWESAPNAAFDLTLRESGGPVLLTLKATHSPVALASVRPAVTLSADKDYELLVTPADASPENTARVRFTTATSLMTAPMEQNPQITLDALLAAMQSDPTRLGDALTLWEKLPRSWRASDQGVRTGFWLAQEAQLPGLLAEVQVDAAKLSNK